MSVLSMAGTLAGAPAPGLSMWLPHRVVAVTLPCGRLGLQRRPSGEGQLHRFSDGAGKSGSTTPATPAGQSGQEPAQIQGAGHRPHFLWEECPRIHSHVKPHVGCKCCLESHVP